jgi:acyl-coenzyme A synthetase/AMP-(fatty) acid ligase
MACATFLHTRITQRNCRCIVTTGEGILAIKAPWPSMMRTVYGDHQRFEMTYFSAFKGYYFTGEERGCVGAVAAGMRSFVVYEVVL